VCANDKKDRVVKGNEKVKQQINLLTPSPSPTLSTHTAIPTPNTINVAANLAEGERGSHPAIVDSGASGTYLAARDSVTLLDTYTMATPITVTLPDGSTVQSIQAGLLDIPCLPPAARVAYVFPALTKSLLSIATLCDNGYTVSYDSLRVRVFDRNGTCILTGQRCTQTGLWLMDLVQTDVQTRGRATPAVPTPQVATGGPQALFAGSMFPVAAAITANPKRATQRNLVAFYHAMMGSPPVSTLTAALRRGYLKLPGLTADMVTKFPPDTMATAKGHLDLVRQGLRSTKARPSEPEASTSRAALELDEEVAQLQDAFEVEPVTAPTLKVTTKIIDLPHWTRQNHTDPTGKFPVESYSLNNYCLVMFSEDANYIHAEPMKTRNAQDYVTAYLRGLAVFEKSGFKPICERLDNEMSPAFLAACEKRGVKLQLVPPHNHRANRAERAIRTFKNHFIAILATADPDFPLKAWDELIPQAVLTLNLMRSSGLTRQVSAWQQMHGEFDFKKYPIAPAGMKVTIHDRPQQRGSWAPHGTLGFYLGPAMIHYRSWRCLAKRTCAVRITDTVEWHPHDLILPLPSPSDLVAGALDWLTGTLKDLMTHNALTGNQRQLISALEPPMAVHLQELRDILKMDEVAKDKEGAEDPQQAASQRVEALARAPPHTGQQESSREEQPLPVQRVVEEGLSLQPPPGYPVPLTATRSGRVTAPPERLLFTAIDLDAVTHEPLTYRSAMNGPDKTHWQEATSTEFNRLLEDTHSMRFITVGEKPKDRQASYFNPQVRTKIKEGVKVYRVRGTVGGDRIDYPGRVSANAAELDTIKILLNAVVSEDAHWMTADITDFYLNTTLPRKEYMRIRLDQIPEDIRLKYGVAKIAAGAQSVMVEISKGMYGLPQAGRLAQDRLVEHLRQHGYHMCPNTPCLFRHESRQVAFSLVVDDFGIKYLRQEDAEHLLAALQSLYKITVDWKGKKYVGITIEHDRQARTITLSMPKYVENALARFGVQLRKAVHSPAIFTPPAYGRKAPQPAQKKDTTPRLTQSEAKRVQEIVGVFMYYARAVDSSMLTIINKIGSVQAEPTKKVADMAQHFLLYAASWPDASTVYHASDMQLAGYSDASYLSESDARSRAGGILFLSSEQQPQPAQERSGSTTPALLAVPPLNGGIVCVSTIIPTVVASAAEAEYAALFIVGQTAEGLRNTLDDLGYPQGPTRLISDNACAVGIANDTVKQKRSKAIDMRFHWIRDRAKKGHFAIDWHPGKENVADFFTKIYSVKDHLGMRRQLVAYPRDDPAPPHPKQSKAKRAR